MTSEESSKTLLTSTPLPQAGKSAASRMTLMPEGEGWVIQDEAGHKYPVLMDETARELVKDDATLRNEEAASATFETGGGDAKISPKKSVTAGLQVTAGAKSSEKFGELPSESEEMDTSEWAASTL